MLKKIFISILLFGVIVSICGACASYFLKPLLEEKVLEAAKKSLGKQMQLSGFDISLLRGIVFLKGLRIENSKLTKYHDLATADEVILDIGLLPTLFRRSLVFEKIYLKNLEFKLKNRKKSLPSIETSSSPFKNSEAGGVSLKQKKLLDTLYIKRLLIENSQFVLMDYSTAPSPTVIEILNINGSIEDVVATSVEEGRWKGAVYLNGQLNSPNEGAFKLAGSFAKSKDTVDFNFKLNLDNVNLVRFLPYYSNTSFAILREAKLDLDSEASCLGNQLNAFQNARVYDIVLQSIAPKEDETLFGLPTKTVIKFFKDLKGDIAFNFKIVGTIDDPKFDPGPVIKQVLANVMRDKIVSRLQELPREVIKISEKALNENLGLTDKLKDLDKGVEKGVKDIKKKFKKIIDY